MQKYVAILAFLSTIVGLVNCYGTTKIVDVNSVEYTAYSEDAIAITGSLRSPNYYFTLKFSIPSFRQNFNLRIDNITVYASQPVTLQLKQYNYGSTTAKLLTKFTVSRGTSNYVRTFAANPYPQMQMLQLYFPKSVVHDAKKLLDVQIVITPLLSSCTGDYFKCVSSYAECIPKTLVGDRFKNCFDGSDEQTQSLQTTTRYYPSSYNSGSHATFYILTSIIVFVVVALLLCCLTSSKCCKSKSDSHSEHRRVSPRNHTSTAIFTIPTVSHNVPVSQSDPNNATTLPPYYYDTVEWTLPPTYDQALQMQEHSTQVLHVQSVDK